MSTHTHHRPGSRSTASHCLLPATGASPLAVACLLLAAVCPGLAQADEWGLQSFRDPFATPDETRDFPALSLDGYLRLRGDTLTNLDLDRGPTPSTGETLYPLPASDPTGSDTLRSGNLRLRLAPRLDMGWETSVQAVIDCLDNTVLGSTPGGSARWAAMNAASTAQQPPSDSIRVKRAWGESLTPFGLLSAGRMGVHWGLGLIANDGNCLDCDQGDTVDGLGFVMPVLGHVVGLSYSIAGSGPSFAPWGASQGQAVDADAADDVRSLGVGLLRFTQPAVRQILLDGGRSVLDYGLTYAYRWQDVDFPLAGDETAPTTAQVVARGFSGHLVDGYLSYASARHSLEFEAVLLAATIDDASLVPGLHTDAVQALQYGGVVRETVRPIPWLQAGLELGLASGDSAPGFGARLGRERDRSRAGDLDGPQLLLPDDRRVDNLRFHPDYHVDLILWRELVGTVTDALYLRPRLELGPWQGFSTELVLIYSQAMEAASTPGGEEPLGVEGDLALRYRSRDGLVASLQYGLLLPLAGLDNPQLGLTASPAQRVHAMLGFLY